MQRFCFHTCVQASTPRARGHYWRKTAADGELPEGRCDGSSQVRRPCCRSCSILRLHLRIQTSCVSSSGSDNPPCISCSRVDNASCVPSSSSENASCVSCTSSCDVDCCSSFNSCTSSCGAALLMTDSSPPDFRRGLHFQRRRCRSCQAGRSTARPVYSRYFLSLRVAH